MAWNTHRLQAVIDLAPSEHVDEVLSRMAPMGHKHINLRGILRFGVAQRGLDLLQHAPIVSNDVHRNEKLTFQLCQRVNVVLSPQSIESIRLLDRHFWHVGYDKAKPQTAARFVTFKTGSELGFGHHAALQSA